METKLTAPAASTSMGEADYQLNNRIQPFMIMESLRDLNNSTIHGTCIKFNLSDPFHIGDKYGGIPLNLLTNFISWIILMILFIMIRKNVVRAMGFRIATTTIQRNQVFFGGDDHEETEEEDKSLNPSDAGAANKATYW